MDPEDGARVRPDRSLVVGGARSVRRPDLDEARTRAGEHVGDAEAVADLDQLAARDDHLATLGECGKREQERRSVVVHDDARFGPGQAAQQRGGVILARAAGAVAQVELEVRVAARGLDDLSDRLRGERRAAEVRMDEYAGRVEHSAKAWAAQRLELAPQALGQIARVGARDDLLARPLDHAARGVDRQRIVEPARELVHRREIAQLHGEKATARRAARRSDR